jgi:hypothetical protein
MRLNYTKLDSATGRLVQESVRYAMTGTRLA